jgi:hypothetical protein
MVGVDFFFCDDIDFKYWVKSMISLAWFGQIYPSKKIVVTLEDTVKNAPSSSGPPPRSGAKTRQPGRSVRILAGFCICTYRLDTLTHD